MTRPTITIVDQTYWGFYRLRLPRHRIARRKVARSHDHSLHQRYMPTCVASRIT